MSTISESLQHITGFLFVLSVLTILWIIVAALGAIFKNIEKKKSPASTTNTATTIQPAADPNEVPEEDLVIIATTVAMLLGQKSHRLVSIKNAGRGWSQEGRRQHVMSHKIN